MGWWAWFDCTSDELTSALECMILRLESAGTDYSALNDYYARMKNVFQGEEIGWCGADDEVPGTDLYKSRQVYQFNSAAVANYLNFFFFFFFFLCWGGVGVLIFLS